MGDVIDGRFEILDILGQGGFSKVYRVRDEVEGEDQGKSVNRSPEHDESPFADPEEESKGLQQRIETLIDRGESKVLEFKATGRKNLHTGERDQKIEFAVLKSLAGFANGYGGTLLVGVNDDGSIRGVEDDLPHLHKSDLDGWALWLTDAVSTALGAATAAELNLSLLRDRRENRGCHRHRTRDDPGICKRRKGQRS